MDDLKEIMLEAWEAYEHDMSIPSSEGLEPSMSELIEYMRYFEREAELSAADYEREQDWKYNSSSITGILSF